MLPSWWEAGPGPRAALSLAETLLLAPIPGFSQRVEWDKPLRYTDHGGSGGERGHSSIWVLLRARNLQQAGRWRTEVQAAGTEVGPVTGQCRTPGKSLGPRAPHVTHGRGGVLCLREDQDAVPWGRGTGRGTSRKQTTGVLLTLALPLI